jgi:hypothetical protein
LFIVDRRRRRRALKRVRRNGRYFSYILWEEP